MTALPGPIHPGHPRHAGRPSPVIQGFFPGGKPRIIQAATAPAPPVRAPVPAPVRLQVANPALQPATRPGQPPRSILPTNILQERSAQSAAPIRPQSPQPILPKSASTGSVQPHAGDAFALPANFTLKPHGSGQPLPEPIQKKMEAFFNTSFADVRVHVGHEAPSIGALAFTHGSDLYFAPGLYNPQSSQGQQLLGHELTHVLQQRAGRVRNPLGTGVAVVQDPALEAEAERMGRRAAALLAPIQAKFGPPGSAALAPVANPGRVGISALSGQGSRFRALQCFGEEGLKQNNQVAYAAGNDPPTQISYNTVQEWADEYFNYMVEYQDNKTGGYHENRLGHLPGGTTSLSEPSRYVELRRPGAPGKKEVTKLERIVVDWISWRFYPNAHYNSGYVEITGLPANLTNHMKTLIVDALTLRSEAVEINAARALAGQPALATNDPAMKPAILAKLQREWQQRQ